MAVTRSRAARAAVGSSSASTSSTLEDAPSDLLWLIFEQLAAWLQHDNAESDEPALCLCRIPQVCTAWRALSCPSPDPNGRSDALWKAATLSCFPRLNAIVRLRDRRSSPLKLSTPFRLLYAEQFRAERLPRPQPLWSSDINDYIFTIELRLDGELMASWVSPEGGDPPWRKDETDIHSGPRLWTTLPDWYAKHPAEWEGALDLALFVTSIDAELHTPATARLYDCFESDRDGVETNFMNNELCVAHGMMDFDACLWADPNDTDGSEGTTGCIEFGVVKC